MVGFAGWDMPVQYAGVIDEHRAVRQAAGLFDVSHMGEFRVRGSGAEAFLDRLTPNNVARLAVGRAHYSGLLTESGTYIDDMLVYRLAEDDFLLVVNAANAGPVLDWVQSHAEGDVEVGDVSEHELADGSKGIEQAKLTLGGHALSLSDSSVESDFTFTPATSLFVDFETEDEMKAAVDAAREQIIAGELAVHDYSSDDSCPVLNF